jgi:hypothetical protein
MNKIEISNTIKDQAHDKAFANIHSCELDIRRLKEEIRADITPFITAEQNEGVLRMAKKELKVWNYLAQLIEMDYGRVDYFAE